MPSREEKLITGEIYHIFNKTMDSRQVFSNESFASLMKNIISYYKSNNTSVSFSKLKSIEPDIKERLLKKIKNKKNFRVEVYAYCLMPTHFHFLLKQKKENGIVRFITDTLITFTRIFNLLNDRKGPIFLTQFKAVRIKTEEQFIHVLRYILLNPYSSGLITSFEELKKYKYSSLQEYMKINTEGLTDKDKILDIFNNDLKKFEQFNFNHADCQKSLEKIKHINEFI